MRKLTFVLMVCSIAILLMIGCSGQAEETPQTQNQMKENENDQGSKDMSIAGTTNYKEVEFKTIDGQPTNLAAFDGKVKLIVNVASKCGYTPQYQGLEDLYRKYQEDDFVVIGFPANNFGNQEPGTDTEIKEFCTSKFDVTFPMMSKISVKGKDIHPLYEYLTTNSDPPGEIEWNFNKFLLDREGNIIARWPSGVEPTSDEIREAVEIAIKQVAQQG